MLRAVLDANVFVSALIRPEGIPARILEKLMGERAFELVLSPPILEEIRRSLKYPHVRKRLKMAEEELERRVSLLGDMAIVVHAQAPVAIVRNDPDDDKYFAAAREGLAAYIVSGDSDVLAIGRYEEIRNLTPRQFLAVLEAERS